MKMLQNILLGLATLFIAAHSLTAQPALSETLYVSASALNLREQPHTGAAILSVAEYGEAVRVTETGPGSSGKWLEVQYGSYEGYMHSDHLTTGYALLMPWAEAPASLPNLNWYAVISTDGGDSLRRVELQVEGDTEPGNFVTVKGPYRYDAFMIIGSIHPLSEGLVSSNPDLCPQTEALYPGMSRPVNWTDPTTLEQYQLNIYGTYTTSPEGYSMYLDYRINASCYSFSTHSTCDQLIFSVPAEQALWEPAYLLWEGDLNRDGWPDFVLMNSQSEYSGTYHLYLGQAPDKGKVVRKVASFEEQDGC
ncbi:MAG: SH3 domain-containing protein [Phaeodactylibacter sp.]|nr:SH3 domain-containing protein [Phaeodactylibacter sp.]